MSFDELLIRHSSPTLAGIKPASLINLRFLEGGTDSIDSLKEKGLSFMLLTGQSGYPLLLVYRLSAINEILKSPVAKSLKIKLKQGVYLWTLGPTFETKAEIKMFQTLGADAVGMSTVPEVICAVHSGMKVLGVSVITNYGTGLQKISPSHEETLAEGEKAAQNLSRLITAFIKEMNNG